MNKEDARKLIGGYATGSLSEDERRALFEAALDDQELFEALAAEQEIKQAIELPGARERLIRALEPAAPALSWWKRPWLWAAASTAGVAAIALVVVSNTRPSPRPPEIAMVRTQAPQRADAPAEARPEVKAPPPPAPARANEIDKLAQGRDREGGKRFVPPPASAPVIREEKALEAPPPPPQPKPAVPGAPAGQIDAVRIAKLASEQEAQQLKDSAALGFRSQNAQTPLGSARQDASELRRGQAERTLAGAAAFSKTAAPVSVKWQLSGNELSVEPRVPAFLYIVSRSATRSELLRSQSNTVATAKVTVPPGAEEVLIVLSSTRIEAPVDVKTEAIHGTDGSLEGQPPLIVRIRLPKPE